MATTPNSQPRNSQNAHSNRGLKFSVQRRAADSVSLNANYTWSRCVGLEVPPNAQFGTGFTDPANPEYDRGHCDADRTFGNHERTASRAPDSGASTWL